jgi:hypothetical protein
MTVILYDNVLTDSGLSLVLTEEDMYIKSIAERREKEGAL